MQANIYNVKFSEKWSGSSLWSKGDVDVLANGDALKAVAKAKKWALARSFEDEKGTMQKCVGFKLQEIILIASAEV